MKYNVGSFDAAARIIAGFAIVAIAHHERSWWGVVAVGPFLTAAFAFCPLYALVGINTCAQDEIDDRHLPPSSATKM